MYYVSLDEKTFLDENVTCVFSGAIGCAANFLFKSPSKSTCIKGLQISRVFVLTLYQPKTQNRFDI